MAPVAKMTRLGDQPSRSNFGATSRSCIKIPSSATQPASRRHLVPMMTSCAFAKPTATRRAARQANRAALAGSGICVFGTGFDPKVR